MSLKYTLTWTKKNELRLNQIFQDQFELFWFECLMSLIAGWKR